MPRRNRVDPFGDLHAVASRGAFTGNRGCLVDDRGEVVRHHAGRAWITCLTSFRGRRVALARPRRWTPIFFLDDGVALAAGHRPCGECRVGAYRAYRDAVTAALGRPRPVQAAELDERLARERLRPGRGLRRATDRITWRAPASALPDGTVVLVGTDGGDGPAPPHLVTGDTLRPFGFAGWGPAVAGPASGVVDVLTPPTSVLALRHGFRPLLRLPE